MSDDSARLLARRMIKVGEGLRLKPYHCTADKLTIGWGRNLSDNGISEDEANAFLDRDIDSVCVRLEQEDFWPSICAARQAVLIDMCFNLGWPRLSGFRKMLGHVRVGDYEAAAREMLDSKWAVQVGGRATKLAKIMRTGDV
jgi:lysozyme